jgi:hypothetical protein
MAAAAWHPLLIACQDFKSLDAQLVVFKFVQISLIEQTFYQIREFPLKFC